MTETTKPVINYDVFEVAANAILNRSLKVTIIVPDVVKGVLYHQHDAEIENEEQCQSGIL